MGKIKQLQRYQLVLGVFFILFGSSLYWLNTYYFSPYSFYSTGSLRYEKAEVTEIVDCYLEASAETNSGYRGRQLLNVKIMSGEFRGELIAVDNHLTKTHNIYAEEGTKVIVCLNKNSEGFHAAVYNYSRAGKVYLMIGLFIALMVLVGGGKGFKSAAGLAFCIICIIFFTLPMVFHGYSPIIITILSTILITTVSLLLIDGATKKMFVALCGTAAGVISAGIIFAVFSLVLKISGFNLDEAESLYMISANTGLQIKDLLFAGVLIAALGAVMDVAMSIASTLNELHEHNPELSSKELFASGLNVGKDMIGTMSNTLVLAYTGSSFGTIVLFMAYSVNYHQLINMDYLVLEISQALAGSMGIVLTVPCASLIGAKFYRISSYNEDA